MTIVFRNYGKASPFVPFGVPRADQAIGTPFEILGEIAGRVCYDSFGSGRSSDSYHAHIVEVNNLSVYEHCVFTTRVSYDNPKWLRHLLNRPGVWVDWWTETSRLRVTMNLRAVLEWNMWSRDEAAVQAGDLFKFVASTYAPRLVAIPLNAEALAVTASIALPSTDDEKWVTAYIVCGRGMSHEIVRHGDFTAISQRSTRYVNESDSALAWHPAFKAMKQSTAARVDELHHACKDLYSTAAVEIESMLRINDIPTTTARKVARGAARNFLMTGTQTQIIFSASLAQWHRIFKQRCSAGADGEIREAMESLREEVLQ